jgi:ABC-type branched-subunit amino acid transport system ATPase component
VGTLLKVNNLKRSFGLETAVKSASFQIAQGETVVLLTENQQSPEKTLLDLLSGTLDPDAGNIYFKGEDITALPPLQRSKRGLVRALDDSSLFADLTIADHILAVSRNLAPTVNDLYAQWQNDGLYLRKGMRRLADVSLHVSMDTKISKLDQAQKRLLGLGLATLEDFDMLLWPLGSVPHLKAQHQENLQYILQNLTYDKKTILLTATNIGLLKELSNHELILEDGVVSDTQT